MPVGSALLQPEASAEDVGMSSAGLGRHARLIRRYVELGRYAGAVSVVARHDKVVAAEVHGLMDVERGRPMGADTIFRIYSMTKPIVSVALLMLYERGLFQLDDPVAGYLPALADVRVYSGGTADDYRVHEPARPITVRDLLMHTAGLAGPSSRSAVGELYRRRRLGEPDAGGTLADLADELGRLPLECDPGSRWVYSISTDLVGHLCEVLSGLPLDVYLQRFLFDPLEMVDTGFHVPAGKLDRFAACYTFRDGRPGYELADDPMASHYARPQTFLSGSRGLVSTAADYLRFCRMLAAGGELDGARILGARTVQYMTTNHLPGGQDLETVAQNGGETHREGQGFGLGFAVLLDPVAAQTLGTPGEYFWGGAASTAFFVNPVEDLICIFLTQLRPSLTYPIRRELRTTIYSAIVH